MDITKKSKNNSRHFTRHQALLLTAASTVALLSVAPMSAAHAEVANAPDMLLADLAPVSDSELAQNRGGFSIGNISLSVGLTVTTAIQGASINPVSVTTNFSIDMPGQLTNLGTQIAGDVANQVSNTLSDAGIGQGSDNSSKGASNTPSTQNSVPASPPPAPVSLASNTPSPPPPPQNTGSGGQPLTQNITVASNTPQSPPPPPVSPPPSPSSSPAPSQVSAVVPLSPPSPPPPPAPAGGATITNTSPPATFTASVDPVTNSISLTNNAGTNLNLSTANGLITTITNNLSGVSVQTQVDLNYVVNNYYDVIANAHNFQQAMSIAQQMLAVRGITGH